MQQGLVQLRTTLVWQFDYSLTTIEHIGELDIKFIRKPKLLVLKTSNSRYRAFQTWTISIKTKLKASLQTSFLNNIECERSSNFQLDEI